MISPLQPVVKYLKIFSWILGNDININKLEESKGVAFERTKFGYLKILPVVVIPYVSAGFMFGYLYVNNISVKIIYDNLRSCGLSMTDVIGLEILSFVNIFSAVLYVILLRRPITMRRLTNLSNRLSELTILLQIDNSKAKTKASKFFKYVVVFLCVSVVSVVTMSFVFFGLLSKFMPLWFSVANAGLVLLVGFFAFTSPAGFTNQVLCNQIMSCISFQVETWNRLLLQDRDQNCDTTTLADFSPLLEEDPRPNDSKQRGNLQKISSFDIRCEDLEKNPYHSADFLIKTGFKIVGCIKLTNSALGPIMFAEVGLALINLAINSYFMCTIYSLFSQRFSSIVLCFVIVNVLLFMVAVYRLINLTNAGENLNTKLDLARDHIQNYMMSNFDCVSENEKHGFECLLTQLSINSPMRPLNGFQLNFNSILAGIGLMTTYTIVLLQFKIDESQQKD